MEYIIQYDKEITSAETMDDTINKIVGNITLDNYKSFKVLIIADKMILKYVFNDDASMLVNTTITPNVTMNYTTPEVHKKLFATTPAPTNVDNAQYLVINNNNTSIKTTKDKIIDYITLNNYDNIKIIDLSGESKIYYLNNESNNYISKDKDVLDIDLSNIMDMYSIIINYWKDNSLKIHTISKNIIKENVLTAYCDDMFSDDCSNCSSDCYCDTDCDDIDNTDETEKNKLNYFCQSVEHLVCEFVKLNKISSIIIQKNNNDIGYLSMQGMYYQNEILYEKNRLMKGYNLACEKITEFEKEKLMMMDTDDIKSIINKSIADKSKEDIVNLYLHIINM